METIIKVFNFVHYCGLTPQELNNCIPEVKRRNVATLSWLLIFMLAAMLLLTVISFIPGSGEEINRFCYIFYTFIAGFELLAFRYHFQHHPDHILVPSYMFMLTAYSFGIIEATCLGEEASGVVFCALLIALPLLIIDIPIRLSVTTLLAELALLTSHFLDGTEGSAKFLVLESLFCTFSSIYCGFVIQKTNFSAIRSQLMLETQRDTDLMTGANSRAAYIRDLGVMCDDCKSAGVIFADVNDLKKTNDTCGHEVGDRLIKDAYALMRRYYHSADDRIYRIGGDEFVIISMGVDRDSFLFRFQAMTESDERRGLISCGCAWLDRVRDAQTAVKEAEKLMYTAKGKFYLEHPEYDRRIV